MSIETDKKAKPAFETVCRHQINEHLEELDLIEENRVMASIECQKMFQADFN